MAHYDLYDALGLDRSQDSVNLAQQIDQKINSGVATNPGGPEELRIARDILGNDQRRRMYDSKLNDPTAPDINIAALRDLAKLKVAENNSSATDAAPTVTSPTNNSQFAGPNPPQQNQGPSSADKAPQSFSKSWSSAKDKFSPVVSKTRDKFQGSSGSINGRLLLIIALIVVLIIVLIALVPRLGSDERQVKTAANDFLELRTSEETEAWLADNAFSDRRDILMSGLSVKSDFAGIDNSLKVTDPRAGEVINLDGIFHAFSYGAEEDYENAYRAAGFDQVAVVTVNNKDGEDTEHRLMFVSVDNDWKLFDLDDVPRIDRDALRF